MAMKAAGYGNSFDSLVKSLDMLPDLIPAEVGIQYFQRLINTLDSGLHRSDGFLRNPQKSYQFSALKRTAKSH